MAQKSAARENETTRPNARVHAISPKVEHSRRSGDWAYAVLRRTTSRWTNLRCAPDQEQQSAWAWWHGPERWAIYYQYRAERARRTLRGIDEQVGKAEKAVAGKTAVERNRFIQLSGATPTLNRALEVKARALAGAQDGSREHKLDHHAGIDSFGPWWPAPTRASRQQISEPQPHRGAAAYRPSTVVDVDSQAADRRPAAEARCV